VTGTQGWLCWTARRLTGRCFTGCTGSVDLFYVDAMEGGTAEGTEMDGITTGTGIGQPVRRRDPSPTPVVRPEVRLGYQWFDLSLAEYPRHHVATATNPMLL
jgi:hypothetical protein